MAIRNKFQRPYMNDEPGVDGTGDDLGTQAADPGLPEGTDLQPGGEGDAKPASMLEAMFPSKPAETPEEKAAAEQRARDEKGRFAAKPDDPNADPAKAAQAKAPEKKQGEDLTKMPDGLSPKAQERFQALANTNRELTSKLEAVSSLVGGDLDAVVPMIQSVQALQQTFQENGVKREQFDMGMQVIGMINRGDLASAQSFLEDQLRQISMVTGKPIGVVDTLAGFPDLREAVDNLQMSEAHALEVARARTLQNNQQQTQRRQQQETQQLEAQQRSIQQGQVAVDKYCKARMADDLDYAKIEPILLKKIQDGLLQGVPPNAWAGIVQKTYELIKETSAMSRSAGTSTTVLRPTGGEAPSAQPKSAFEAMWGKPAPAGA